MKSFRSNVATTCRKRFFNNAISYKAVDIALIMSLQMVRESVVLAKYDLQEAISWDESKCEYSKGFSKVAMVCLRIIFLVLLLPATRTD